MSNPTCIGAALRYPAALLLLLCAFGGTAIAATTAPVDSIEGTVVVQVADDFAHGLARYTYFLRDLRTNQQLELKLDTPQLQRLRPGQKVRVRGQKKGAALLALTSEDAVTVLAEPAMAMAAPTAARRVITMLVDIVDGDGILHSVNSACDGPQQLTADLTFGSQSGQRNVDGCFQDASLGAVGFGGATYPGSALNVVRVQISEPQGGFSGLCLYDSWAASAGAAAQAKGVNLDAYQHRMYVLPPGTGCTWTGLAYVGCYDVCQAWLISYLGDFLPCGYPDTIAHELGHNLGFMHASSDADNDGIIRPDEVYGDAADVMGPSSGAWRAFNAPHREWMGWLPPSRTVDGSAGGTFTISAIDMPNPPYPQAVKLYPATGSPYWLSFLAPVGYDAGLVDNYGSPMLNKLQIHRASGGNSSLIRSMGEGATPYQADNWTMKLVSHTANSAVVSVQVAGTDTTAPSVTITRPANGAKYIQNGGTTTAYSCTDDQSTNVTCQGTVPVGSAIPAASTGSKTFAVTARDDAANTTSKTTTYTVVAATAAYTLSPTSLAFGNRALNVVSSAQTITLRNVVSVPLKIMSIAVSGTNPSQYKRTHTCGYSVPPGASCEIKVIFKPTSTGSKPAKLVITAGTAAGAREVSLSGTGVSWTYSLSTSSLAFGTVTRNTTSVAKTVRISNTSIVALPISSISLGGTNPTQFAFTKTCSSTLAAGASCTVSAVFKPTSTGAKSATLKVTPGGGAAAKTVALSGTGK